MIESIYKNSKIILDKKKNNLHFNLSILPTEGRLSIIFFLTILSVFTANNNAQVIIKEKVEINPQSTINKSGIGGDNRNPVYLRYGGSVSARQIRSVSGNYEL